MTVRQVGCQTLDVPKDIVAQQTKIVLGMNLVYRNLKEITEGTVFKVRVKPNIFLLGTDMTIVLDENDSATTVTTTTTSQPFIIGDVGGFYYRYVRDFLNALESALRDAKGFDVVSSEAKYRMEVGEVGAAFLFAIALFSAWVGLVLNMSFLLLLAAIMLTVSFVGLFHGGRFLP
jgi:hypothetical protein